MRKRDDPEWKKVWLRAFHKRHPERAQGYKRKARLKKYGLTLADESRMLAEQNNKCACCGEPFTVTPSVEHNHTTGKVRGLVCQGCNLAISMIETGRSAFAAAYLERQQ